MSAPTEAQSVMLAAIEQEHHVHRIPDDSPLADQVLSRCVTDTRIYRCEGCHAIFSIEPDGETGIWGALVD